MDIREEKLTGIENQLTVIQTGLNQITSCLLGTPFTENKGLVHNVADQENRISGIEKFIDRAKVFIVVSLAFSGYGAFELFNKLIDVISK